MDNSIIFTDSLERDFTLSLAETKYDRVFVLTDENTHRLCWPRMKGFRALGKAEMIIVKAGDDNKTIAAVSEIWDSLSDKGATRKSCLVNLGGGMVCDMGGFAAATFKRGMTFVNVPTTLLAMVDAAAGGKTGCNYHGLKNEIGVFRSAKSVIVDTAFLETLGREEILSGYAEMLKHAMLDSHAHWADILSFNLGNIDLGSLRGLVAKSVAVKSGIVEADPMENGLRKALNLGHTAGHAFESLAIRRGCPVPHGYAVAYGIVCELYMSCVKLGFPSEKMRQTADFVKEHYGKMDFSCDDYAELIAIMGHDKKNVGGNTVFTLMEDIGRPVINSIAGEGSIREMLDFYREGL